MKNKKKIIIFFVILILIIVLISSILIINKKDNSEETKKDIINWEEEYIKILQEESFDTFTNMTIQLLDINIDDIPELIVYGTSSEESKYLANIYTINSKNELDIMQIEEDITFSIRLTYDLDYNDYIWYLLEDNTYYDMNIKSEEYILKKIDTEILDIIEIYSGKVSFEKELENSEKLNLFETAKERYIKVESMITDEVKTKVNEAILLKNIQRLDSSKEIVYSAIEAGSYKYPIINIDSDDVKTVNSTIKSNYGFTQTDVDNGQLDYMELEEITYEYYINDNILSVILEKGGNSSTWMNSYNINLETSTTLTTDEMLSKFSLDKDTVIENIKSVAEKELETATEEQKEDLSEYWDGLYAEEAATWKTQLDEYIEKLENVYIDSNGDVCASIEFEQIGGQWTCTKTIEINISKGYTLSYISYNGESSEIKRSNTSSKTEGNQNSSTIISIEDAQILAQSVIGTEDETTGWQIGYSYEAIIKDVNGKQYYAFDIAWLVDEQWTWIGAICIAVDGKSYQQIDTKASSYEDGDIVNNMSNGGEF